MDQQSSAGATNQNDHKDPLALPSLEVLKAIEARQDARAKEIRDKRRAAALNNKNDKADATAGREARAAELIQRNYRGHRARRAISGRGLDASTRWIEALKAAKYSQATAPRSREHHASLSGSGKNGQARSRWKRAGAIAHRAGSDDTSEQSEGEAGNEDEKAAMKRRKQRAEKYAKVMGLDYFLEMVDHKHRYGSNLRRYHKEWKQADTHENFFHWLDEGAGKNLDLEDRPRSRLDSEFVRYLSKEERLKYVVNIDSQGRFVFAKNGKPVTTSREFKDSIEGIVPEDSEIPTWREVTTGKKDLPPPPSDDDSLSSMSSIGTGKHEDNNKYQNEELHNAHGFKKLAHVNVDTIKAHMLRKTTKANTWIFVADTSFRLYVGIKQSGAFQHSSFLQGARVAAAGLIKIKRGQLRKLSPLSGHYSPPIANFREFVKNLKDHGADMSRCNISRSYAVLLGLEGYLGAKKHVKLAEQGLKDVLNPDAKKEREEREKDKSQAAAREREVLAEQQRLERRERSFSLRMKRKIGIGLDGVDRTDTQPGG